MADSKEHTFITGSNAEMLSSEIESRLGGRYLTKYVSPYNFREFLTAKGINFSDDALYGTNDRAKIIRALETYFYHGGFPESINYQDKREYVSSVYQKVLLGDMAVRHEIRNAYGLRLLMKKVGESVKDAVSYSKLFNILKTIGVSISKDSVIEYVGYAKEAYLIFAIKNFFSKFVERETTPKYYFSDNGLLNLFLFNKESQLLENLVSINLWNKYGEDLYYLKSSTLDIDFFVQCTGEVIQVAYSLDNISNDRETKALIQAAKTVKEAKRFVIITYNEEDEIMLDGVRIEVIPVWKWLIQDR